MVRPNVQASKLTQLPAADRRVGLQQATVGGNYLDPALPAGRARKAIGVRQLSSEVEPTEEAECFSQSHSPGRAKTLGKRKGGVLIEQNGGALTAAMSWRKQEYFKPGHQGNLDQLDCLVL